MPEIAIVGATVIDGAGGPPRHGATVLIRDGRIVSVESEPPDVQVEQIEASGKYVVPGLMDANVHLVPALPDILVANEGRYHELALEGAAISLRNGVTTVFDTWGPLEPLATARDRIESGLAPGSRIRMAGNIVGFAGPLSADFFGERDVAAEDIERINAMFEMGVGTDLLWLPAQEVGKRVREYLGRGLADFVKYGSSGHKEMNHLLFSERAQREIVESAHEFGHTAQAHVTSPESLKVALDAGVDLIQHPDCSGIYPLGDDLLDELVSSQIGCAAMLATERFLAWNEQASENMLQLKVLHEIKDVNNRRLIERGAKMLLTTDGYITRPEMRDDPMLGFMLDGVVDLSTELGEGHFRWLEAVTERGMAPMAALQAATRNIAETYGVADELGTLEPGKRADLVVLDADPLADATNYQRISAVLKDGAIVDREMLPVSPWRAVAN